MNNLVFLDVGANTGQSLEAAMLYKFDRIFCFEPVKRFYIKLNKTSTSHFPGKVIYNNFGLSNRYGRLPIYGPVDGPDGYAASMYSDHQDVKDGIEMCSFVDVTHWMKINLIFGDFVVMKLNCEGAEIDILNNLVDNNVFGFIGRLMIDFDAVKIPSKHNELESTIRKISGFTNYALADDVMHGATHKDRICHWLDGLKLPRLRDNI